MAIEKPNLTIDAQTALNLARSIADKDSVYQADFFDAYRLADAYIALFAVKQPSAIYAQLAAQGAEIEKLNAQLAFFKCNYDRTIASNVDLFRTIQELRTDREKLNTVATAQAAELRKLRTGRDAPHTPPTSPPVRGMDIGEQIADFSASMTSGLRPYP